MININKLHKYFIILILSSSFLIYFTKNSALAYGPSIFLMLLIIFFEFYSRRVLSYKDTLTVVVWLPFVLLASFYYILNPLEGKYITANFIVLLSLPIITLSIISIRRHHTYIDYINFNYKLIFYFLLFELLVCLGQMSTYMFGFGFPLSPENRALFIVPGSFNNPNDLASIVLLCSFSFICFEKSLEYKKVLSMWILIFILTFITGSRSTMALIALMFFIYRGFKYQQIKTYFIVFTFIFFIIFLLPKNNETLSYFFNRLDSLLIILTEGSSKDGSINLRLDSYIYFLNNIKDLGLGSGEIGNYYKYSTNANFPTGLMFKNPHSLIVEVGYWLGILGIILLLIPIFYLLSFSDKKILLLVIFLISSSISSSVLDSFIYFYMLIYSFFISRKEFYGGLQHLNVNSSITSANPEIDS